MRTLAFIGAGEAGPIRCVAYQIGPAGRSAVLVTSPFKRRDFSFRRMTSAPAMLAQTSRTPPSGRRSMTDMPTLALRHFVTTSPSGMSRYRDRSIVAPWFRCSVAVRLPGQRNKLRGSIRRASVSNWAATARSATDPAAVLARRARRRHAPRPDARWAPARARRQPHPARPGRRRPVPDPLADSRRADRGGLGRARRAP